MKKLIACLIIVIGASLLLFGCENQPEYMYDPDHYDREALCKYLTNRLKNRDFTYPDQITNPEQKRLVDMYNSHGCDK